MQLSGIHHVTAITADSQGCVDFYAGLLGLRLVKKTVNFDAPEVYHLYFGDETGSPGSIMTFFEFPDAALGRAGAGMIHRLIWRVSDIEAIGYWAERLSAAGVDLIGSGGDSLLFSDPEGLEIELVAEPGSGPARIAHAEDIPDEHALLGFAGVRAFAAFPKLPESVLTELLGFEHVEPARYRCAGPGGSSDYFRDAPPPATPIQGAGTVHHIAWACPADEHEAWLKRLDAAAAHATPIIDRQYFMSIYFREPGGVLFEIATNEPGFDVDEFPAHLGEELKLPPQYEGIRDRLEGTLRPIVNPRQAGHAALDP